MEDTLTQLDSLYPDEISAVKPHLCPEDCADVEKLKLAYPLVLSEWLATLHAFSNFREKITQPASRNHNDIARINELELEVYNANQTLQHLKNHNKAKSERIYQMEGEIAFLEADKIILKRDLSSLEADNIIIKRDLEESALSSKMLSDKINLLQIQCNELNARYQASETNVLFLKTQAKNLESQREFLNTQAKEAGLTYFQGRLQIKRTAVKSGKNDHTIGQPGISPNPIGVSELEAKLYDLGFDLLSQNSPLTHEEAIAREKQLSTSLNDNSNVRDPDSNIG